MTNPQTNMRHGVEVSVYRSKRRSPSGRWTATIGGETISDLYSSQASAFDDACEKVDRRQLPAMLQGLTEYQSADLLAALAIAHNEGEHDGNRHTGRRRFDIAGITGVWDARLGSSMGPTITFDGHPAIRLLKATMYRDYQWVNATWYTAEEPKAADMAAIASVFDADNWNQRFRQQHRVA